MVAIACIVSLVDKSNLTTVAHIQVVVGFATCVAKFGYPMMKGWDKPFRGGICKSIVLFRQISFVLINFFVL